MKEIQERRSRILAYLGELVARRPLPAMEYGRASARYMEMSWIMHCQPTADALRMCMSDLRGEYETLIHFKPRPLVEIDRNVHRWHALNWALGNRGIPLEAM